MKNPWIAPKGIYGFILFIFFIGLISYALYIYVATIRGYPPSLFSEPTKSLLSSIEAQIKPNIRIAGKTGVATYNVYVESNPTDKNGYYSVYRLVYDAINYTFKESDFDSINEIRGMCHFLVRKQPDSNSLLYTDWDMSVSSDDKYYYLYVVTQDDGDFSNCVIFK